MDQGLPVTGVLLWDRCGGRVRKVVEKPSPENGSSRSFYGSTVIMADATGIFRRWSSFSQRELLTLLWREVLHLKSRSRVSANPAGPPMLPKILSSTARSRQIWSARQRSCKWRCGPWKVSFMWVYVRECLSAHYRIVRYPFAHRTCRITNQQRFPDNSSWGWTYTWHSRAWYNCATTRLLLF